MNCILCNSNNIYLEESGKTKHKEIFEYFRCKDCDLVQSEFNEAKATHYENVEHYKDRWEFTECLKYIISTPEMNVLEIGCGEGYFAKKIRYEKLRYTGIDFNENALKVASKENPNKRFIATEVKQFLNTELRDLDAFFAFHVLEHFRNPLEIVTTVSARLKSGGYIVFSVPNEDRIAVHNKNREHWDYPPHHLTRWSEKSLKRLAEETSMEVLKIIDEPLKLSEHKEFSKLGILSNKIKNTWTRRAFKLLCYPLDYCDYLLSKKTSTGQAKLIILRKP